MRAEYTSHEFGRRGVTDVGRVKFVTWALESLAVVRRLGLRPTQCATTNGSGCYHARAHPSGYRQCEELADRLRFIKGAQRFGLRLEEIKELLDIQD